MMPSYKLGLETFCLLLDLARALSYKPHRGKPGVTEHINRGLIGGWIDMIIRGLLNFTGGKVPFKLFSWFLNMLLILKV